MHRTPPHLLTEGGTSPAQAAGNLYNGEFESLVYKVQGLVPESLGGSQSWERDGKSISLEIVTGDFNSDRDAKKIVQKLNKLKGVEADFERMDDEEAEDEYEQSPLWHFDVTIKATK